MMTRRRAWHRSFVLLGLAAGVLIAVAPSLSFAQPTQEEVFRSIGQNLDRQQADHTTLLALLSAAGGLTMLLIVLSYRRQRQVQRKAFHHHGKLIKEIAKAISLKPAELKQLRLLAGELNLANPITLLLCPELISRGADGQETRADRAILAQLARRLTTSS